MIISRGDPEPLPAVTRFLASTSAWYCVVGFSVCVLVLDLSSGDPSGRLVIRFRWSPNSAVCGVGVPSLCVLVRDRELKAYGSRLVFSNNGMSEA